MEGGTDYILGHVVPHQLSRKHLTIQTVTLKDESAVILNLTSEYFDLRP